MRGAHDNGSHGSKCLMGLRPGKRRDCGNGAESWEWAWAIAGTTCRSVKRHTSCLAMANAPAMTMSAEKRTQKSPFAFSSRFLDPITTDIRTNPTASGTKASGNSGFSMASHLERCGSDFSMFGFLRLLTRAMEQHVDTHRFTMQVAAGSSRMNG